MGGWGTGGAVLTLSTIVLNFENRGACPRGGLIRTLRQSEARRDPAGPWNSLIRSGESMRIMETATPGGTV